MDECQTLVGNQWDLVEYNGGWSGYYIFEEPYIHWVFYEADSLVVTFSDYKVTDNMGVPPNYLYAGTYDYVLDGEGGINISNESISQDYDVVFSDGGLILSNNPEVDGTQYDFICN